MDAKALGQVVAVRVQRIDVGSRILEDHRHPTSANGADSVAGESLEIDTVEEHLTTGAGRRR